MSPDGPTGTWQRVFAGDTFGPFSLGLTFVDEHLGWVDPPGALVLVTDDGGINWRRASTQPDALGLTDVSVPR